MLKGPEVSKIAGVEIYYYGQKDKSDRFHGKGILYIPKTNYLYYGFFADNDKDNFGREFYNEQL